MNICKWPIGNNDSLSFVISAENQNWDKVAGLYIFAKFSGNNWYALYVGQTDDFSARLPNHERWNEAIQNGATHIHTLVAHMQSDRDLYEKRLIRTLQPLMNQQLKD